jgi:CRISPR/Cas system-associated endonuclease Cas1
MSRILDPFRFVLIAVAGWMNQRQLQVIDYLREENRVLREQLGARRLRLNDDQRRRLAAKGLGRKLLAEVAHHRHARDVAGLASKADCAEI